MKLHTDLIADDVMRVSSKQHGATKKQKGGLCPAKQGRFTSFLAFRCSIGRFPFGVNIDYFQNINAKN